MRAESGRLHTVEGGRSIAVRHKKSAGAEAPAEGLILLLLS
jgi:hypothetical protein